MTTLLSGVPEPLAHLQAVMRGQVMLVFSALAWTDVAWLVGLKVIKQVNASCLLYIAVSKTMCRVLALLKHGFEKPSQTDRSIVEGGVGTFRNA